MTRACTAPVHDRPWRTLVLAAFLVVAADARAVELPPSPVSLPLLLHAAALPVPPFTHADLAPALAHRPSRGSEPLGRRERASLLAHLARLATVGPRTRPELFPTDDDALAYLINAHMGWTVALGTEPETRHLPALARRHVPFPLDGRTMTLEALAAEIVARAAHEPRVVLFLNPGLAAGPPLPPWPLAGHSLAWQLAHHARTCGAQPSFWHLDETRREVRLSAFTAHMPGLPRTAPERTARLLELIPPPPPLGERIVAVCGPSMQRCTHAVAPLDPQGF